MVSNPAQGVRRQTVHRSEGRGLDRFALRRCLFGAEALHHDHAALAVLLELSGLRVSEACATNIEDFGLGRGHAQTLRIMGKGAKPAVIPLVARTARTVDLAVGERSPGPILRRSRPSTPARGAPGRLRPRRASHERNPPSFSHHWLDLRPVRHRCRPDGRSTLATTRQFDVPHSRFDDTESSDVASR